VSLTSNGNDYFVVWEDYRNSSSIPDVFGARVTSGGTVSDANGIAISTVPGTHERDPDTAFNGTDYLVVWEDSRNGPGSNLDIFGARISVAGAVVANSLPIATATSQERRPAIARASSGSECLVVFYQAGIIRGTRVASNGSVVQPAGFLIGSSAVSQVAVGALSAGYLVVWYAYNSIINDVYGARVTMTGTVLDPPGSELKITDNSGLNGTPHRNSVAANATTYLVAHTDNLNPKNVKATFVSP